MKNDRPLWKPPKMFYKNVFKNYTLIQWFLQNRFEFHQNTNDKISEKCSKWFSPHIDISKYFVARLINIKSSIENFDV